MQIEKKFFIAKMVILIDKNDFALKIFYKKDVFQGSGLKGLIQNFIFRFS